MDEFVGCPLCISKSPHNIAECEAREHAAAELAERAELTEQTRWQNIFDESTN